MFCEKMTYTETQKPLPLTTIVYWCVFNKVFVVTSFVEFFAFFNRVEKKTCRLNKDLHTSHCRMPYREDRGRLPGLFAEKGNQTGQKETAHPHLAPTLSGRLHEIKP
jgi:hypothetical protein